MKLPEHQLRVYETTRDVLEKLLELMELPARVNLSEAFTVVDESGETESVGLNIEGDDLGILIGRRGQTMLSLQHILRLMVASTAQVKMPIVLDVEGYKERRCEGLRALAFRLADQVTARKASFPMEPMTAFERRIIHLALADHPDVITESTGQGEARKVVIIPKKLPEY
jgi:spoIIIJ-associated protein